MAKEKVLDEKYLLIYGKYLQVAIFLQHSNRIQLRYKLLTFTWFMATFIGMGYALSVEEVNLPFPPFLIVPVLCIASLCVVGIVWYLDTIVQEKNIATAVHQGLDLEKKYAWLPQAYHNVVKMDYLHGYIYTKSVFYLGCATILFLTICYSLSAYLFLDQSRLYLLPILVTLLIIPMLFALSNWVTKRSDPYRIIGKKHGN